MVILALHLSLVATHILLEAEPISQLCPKA